MRKFALALFLVAASASAQYTNFNHHATASAGHANGLPAAAYPTLCSSVAVLGNFIYFSGSCWQALATPADGTYSLTFTGGVPSYTAAGGSAFSAITSGTNTTAAMVVGTGASLAPSGSGAITATVLSVLTGMPAEAANTVVANVTSGSASPTAAALPSCVDSGGNHLNYTNGTGFSCGTSSSGATGTGAAYSVLGNGTTGSTTRADIAASFSSVTEPIQGLVCTSGVGCSWSRLPFDTTVATIINSEFSYYGTAGGVGLAGGQAMFQVTGTGTSEGIQASGSIQFTTDTNHPNALELTTGTTNTGGWTLGSRGTASIPSGWGVKTGMVIDWLYNVPVLSGATNTFRDFIGLWDTTATTAIANGVYVTLDSNTDTHWAINSCKATVCQGNTASSLVATTGWHHITAVATGATSVTYYVDGTSIGTTSTAADMPVTFNMTPSLRRVASAGCAAVGTCYSVVNTVFAYEPVSR